MRKVFESDLHRLNELQAQMLQHPESTIQELSRYAHLDLEVIYRLLIHMERFGLEQSWLGKGVRLKVMEKVRTRLADELKDIVMTSFHFSLLDTEGKLQELREARSRNEDVWRQLLTAIAQSCRPEDEQKRESASMVVDLQRQVPCPAHGPAAMERDVFDVLTDAEALVEYKPSMVQVAPVQPEVVLFFSSAPHVRRKAIHRLQSHGIFQRDEECSLIYYGTLPDWNESRSWLLGLGSGARVLSPDWMRLDVLNESTAVIGMYEERRKMTMRVPGLHCLDVIGDVHGCFKELTTLMRKLGYELDSEDRPVRHPENRKLVFIGDVIDRGPESVAVLKCVMQAISNGLSWLVAGNHEDKLRRCLKGNPVVIEGELGETLRQLRKEPDAFIDEVKKLLDGMPPYLLFDDDLVIVHGALPETNQGLTNRETRNLALYGSVTGKVDVEGKPVRIDWAETYAGKRFVIYGHTPVEKPTLKNRTINIDTGCYETGILTAYRWPEKEIVSTSDDVSAR